jgi:hypothetical protein
VTVGGPLDRDEPERDPGEDLAQAVRDTIAGLEAMPLLTPAEGKLLRNLKATLAAWEADVARGRP